MTIQLTSVGGALALALTLIVLPGPASAQSGTPDCVRRASPPSSSPHDVFRRTLYVCSDQTAARPDSVRAQATLMPGRIAPAPATSPAPARSAQADM